MGWVSNFFSGHDRDKAVVEFVVDKVDLGRGEDFPSRGLGIGGLASYTTTEYPGNPTKKPGEVGRTDDFTPGESRKGLEDRGNVYV
jgi:hypothetical protein